MLEPLTEAKAIVLLTDQLADAHRDLTAARLRIAELEAALDGVEKCALDELHALAAEDLSTAQIKLIAAEIARRVRNSL